MEGRVNNFEKGRENEKLLTQEYLREIFDYDLGTGILKWKWRDYANKSWNTRFAGKVVGNENDGYVKVMINGISYFAHRIVYCYVHGYFSEHLIDHKNGVRNDNRICNLREVSQSCNIKNVKGLRKSNTSGITGVCWDSYRNRWKTSVHKNKKQIHAGYYEDFTDAVIARYKAELDAGYTSCIGQSTAYKYLLEKAIINSDGSFKNSSSEEE